MDVNPYESPKAAADIATPGKAVEYKLYSAGQIAVSAFLGSIFAGCVLLAINYSNVGNRKLAVRSIIGGVIATALLCMAANAIPEQVPVPSAAWAVISAAAMFQLAESLQDAMFRRHIHLHKGLKASSWKAVGIALLCALIVGLLIVAGFVTASLLLPVEDLRAE